MQLPMMTIPSVWTGLGRMSQARTRCQDELEVPVQLVVCVVDGRKFGCKQ
jgi:hypothetical protein